ncbi:hypothetical protein AYI70_g8836 [Smittium culicis]|uniref:Uncharacterized protein n=1 Tax=Smittium culicis TaxID=133412 RepID=A0A1R1XE74_9FUNG|nr:hypothetical protein AYI70_g8836 [Smittium culicis]
MNALYKLAHDLDGCIYIRKDDHRARITYLIFSKKDDAQNVMQKIFSHNLKEIEMYQTEKLEEDNTVDNIPNLGDVDILTLLDLIKETIEPISEIIDISALCRKGLTEFLPYEVKILIKIIAAETIIPSFLQYEHGRISIFYRGFKEACSYCKQEGQWKSGCEVLLGSKNKFSKKMTTSEENITTKANSSEKKAEDKVIESPDSESTVTDTIESDNISPPVDAEVRSPRSRDSDGYSPPTELDRMAQKARNGEITEEQYIIFYEEYIKNNFTQSEVEMDSGTDDGDELGSSETHSQMEANTDL